MVYMSLLITLSIVLTRLFSFRFSISGIEGIRIGFGSLPIILAGIVFGPLAGGIVGALADIIGFFINPMGAFFPQITLTSFLTGFIPGVLNCYILGNTQRYWQLFTAILIGQIISSVVLVPFFLYHLAGLPIISTLVPQIITTAIQTPFYAYFIKFLLNLSPLKKLRTL